jgi:hypothetical protein
MSQYLILDAMLYLTLCLTALPEVNPTVSGRVWAVDVSTRTLIVRERPGRFVRAPVMPGRSILHEGGFLEIQELRALSEACRDSDLVLCVQYYPGGYAGVYLADRDAGIVL